MKNLQKHGLKWEPYEVDFLQDSAGKITPFEIAVHLQRTVESIYTKSRREKIDLHKLIINRIWTKERVDSLVLLGGEIPFSDLENLIGLPGDEIKRKAEIIRTRVNPRFNPRFHISGFYHKITGINHELIQKNIWSGFIKSEKQKYLKESFTVVHEEEFRKYLQSRYSKRMFPCILCSELVMGDLYCEDHLPEEFEKIQYDDQIVLNTFDKQSSMKLLNTMFKNCPYLKKEVSVLSGYTPQNFITDSNGDNTYFDLEKFSKYAEVMGYELQLIATKIETNCNQS